MTSESTATRIKEIMVQVLDLDIAPEQIDDGLSLYSSNIRLDSLGFLHLIIALEDVAHVATKAQVLLGSQPLPARLA